MVLTITQTAVKMPYNMAGDTRLGSWRCKGFSFG